MMTDPLEDYKSKYHFFLSELVKGVPEKECGFIIEFMRAAENIQSMNRLLLSLNPPQDLKEEEELEYWLDIDSTIIFGLNINAAHFREALKLFSEFQKTALFQEFRKSIHGSGLCSTQLLEKAVEEYNKPGNIMNDALIPLRNIVFHYDPSKAETWVKSTIKDERGRKPIEHSLDPDGQKFGIGADYNQSIYSEHLFMPKNMSHSFLKFQKDMGDLQKIFISFVTNLSFFLLKRADIKKRDFGWGMQYFYEFRNP